MTEACSSNLIDNKMPNCHEGIISVHCDLETSEIHKAVISELMIKAWIYLY